jgi:predicted ATP-binding protein involved in virulence
LLVFASLGRNLAYLAVGIAVMKAIRLDITNFRGISSAKIDFDPAVTVLVGKNGGGKSTIIDAVSLMLSWVIARVRTESGRGSSIDEIDIKNGESESQIQLVCDDFVQGGAFEFYMKRPRRGTAVGRASQWAELNERGKIARQGLANGELQSLPVIAYYPVSRAVLDIPLRIRGEHSFGPLDAYESALQGSANFRIFFEWFRNREDLENEERLSEGKIDFRDPQLQAVRHAIEAFMPGFSGLSVKRNPLRMEVRKHGHKLLVNQLSMGEKCLLAMVGDLARRLAVANPQSVDPLQGKGIVLIDEVDLHLHPQWQRTVIGNLVRVFPNCQFIVSTHSPQVVGEVAANQLRVLKIDAQGEVMISQPELALGLDASEVLETIMDADVRNLLIDSQLQLIFKQIDREEFGDAKKNIERLREQVKGTLPEIVRAETMIALLEP